MKFIRLLFAVHFVLFILIIYKQNTHFFPSLAINAEAFILKAATDFRKDNPVPSVYHLRSFRRVVIPTSFPSKYCRHTVSETGTAVIQIVKLGP
jgi:hypothetical protein